MRKSFILILMCTLVGCSAGEVNDTVTAVRKRPSAAAKARRVHQDSDRSSNAEKKPAEFRKVIYDAEFSLAVEDFSLFSKQIPKLILELGGYVAEVSIRQNQDFETKESYRTGTWKLKVRSENFDRFVVRLSEIGFVENHHQESEDVTEEFVDLSARIRNKKTMEARVLELISASNRSLKEVMNLEKELSRIRSDIERMEGQLNLLEKKSSYATATINVTEKRKPVVVKLPSFDEKISETWSGSFGLLVNCLKQMAVIFVAIFPWAVVVSIVSTATYFIYSWLRKRFGIQSSLVS